MTGSPAAAGPPVSGTSRDGLDGCSVMGGLAAVSVRTGKEEAAATAGAVLSESARTGVDLAAAGARGGVCTTDKPCSAIASWFESGSSWPPEEILLDEAPMPAEEAACVPEVINANFSLLAVRSFADCPWPLEPRSAAGATGSVLFCFLFCNLDLVVALVVLVVSPWEKETSPPLGLVLLDPTTWLSFIFLEPTSAAFLLTCCAARRADGRLVGLTMDTESVLPTLSG